MRTQHDEQTELKLKSTTPLEIGMFAVSIHIDLNVANTHECAYHENFARERISHFICPAICVRSRPSADELGARVTDIDLHFAFATDCRRAEGHRNTVFDFLEGFLEELQMLGFRWLTKKKTTRKTRVNG